MYLVKVLRERISGLFARIITVGVVPASKLIVPRFDRLSRAISFYAQGGEWVRWDGPGVHSGRWFSDVLPLGQEEESSDIAANVWIMYYLMQPSGPQWPSI